MAKSQKGITLVALVVTIIILIILSTITLDAVLGENGLIHQARKSQEQASNTINNEDQKLNEAEQNYANVMGEDKEIIEPFEPGPTPEPPTGGEDISSKMRNGVIEIKWLSGTSNKVSDTPNAPVTKSISNGTMELVKFDSSSKTWVPGEEYSYTKGTGSSDNNSSKWANARVTINDVDSYFVWIPRYAYRIIYFDSADSKKAYQEGTLTESDAVENGKIIGYSDSRGIVDASGKKVDSIASTTKTMVSKDYFMVHPAFINDVDAGGWTSELPGIWIGKYETSSVEGNSDSTRGDNVTTKTAKVQPGVSSWRYITIGNMYTNALAYSPNLNSHMLKNSEWGAVAYLTHSQYGRNGTEIAINNSSNYITGTSGGTANASSSDATYAYNDTTNGVLASSTGNVYGIYDLSGGAREYVAAYYGESSYLANGSSFANETSDRKYSTVYGDSGITGDATTETSGWNDDYADFVNSNYPFFERGGVYSDGSSAGVFFFIGYNGSSYGNFSFRVSLAIQ